ncbi:MAG: elongation factor Ts [Candidatus Cloacimonadota bacterium]|nr:MAG: elongation factor Ts [Candidatus Cloacimonadota bacterium]
MAISAKLVMDLRKKTGAGMMDCKKALIASEGDMDKAIDWLREKGISKAAKKADRIAAEGNIFAAVSEDKKTGVILEFNCETDFVAKGEEFKNLGQEITNVVLNNDIADVETLNNFEIDGVKIIDKITEKIAKIGENMSIRRFEKINSEGFVHTYIHMGGKIGVLINAGGDANEENIVKAKDVAMHAAAMNPRYFDKSQISEADLEKEREMTRKELVREGKPEKIIDKIIIGKMNRFYEDNCLMQQKFVKDDKISVEKYADSVKVLGFSRFMLGEGIEKKSVDFAAEVAEITGA